MSSSGDGVDFLKDEDVPEGVAVFLEARGHSVERSLAVLGPGTPDLAVATYADKNRRILLTFNLRDYNNLICRAPRAGFDRFPDAGLVAFQCPHPRGVQRIETFILNLEHEHSLLAAAPAPADRRLLAQITDTVLKILR